MMNILTIIFKKDYSREARLAIDFVLKLFGKEFNIQIAWYAIFILSGALIGSLFGYFYYGKRLHLSSDLVCEGLALGLFFGILFARLYYVLFSLNDGMTYSSFIDVIDPRNGGLAIHGAIIAVALYLPIWTRVRKIKLLPLLEIALPLILFAQVVGRWGNFMNREAFGSLVKFSGEVEGGALSDEQLHEQIANLKKLLIPDFVINNMYIDGSNPASSSSGFTYAGYYQPTFLYESVLNFIGLTAYMITRKFVKKIYVGDGISFYLIWYGGVRIFIESLRSDPLIISIFGLRLKQAICISVFMIICGIAFLILRRVLKIELISCYDALYGADSTLLKEESSIDKNEGESK